MSRAGEPFCEESRQGFLPNGCCGVDTAEKLSFSTPQTRSQCLVVVCMVLFVFGFLPLIGRGFELICPGRRERGCCDLPKGHTTRDIVHKPVSSLDSTGRRGRRVCPKTLMSLHTRVFHPFPLPAWPWEVRGFGPPEVDSMSPLIGILGAPTFPRRLGF